MFPFGNEPYVYVCCFNRLSDIVDLVVIFFHALTTLEAIRYIYVKVVVGPLVIVRPPGDVQSLRL